MRTRLRGVGRARIVRTNAEIDSPMAARRVAAENPHAMVLAALPSRGLHRLAKRVLNVPVCIRERRVAACEDAVFEPGQDPVQIREFSLSPMSTSRTSQPLRHPRGARQNETQPEVPPEPEHQPCPAAHEGTQDAPEYVLQPAWPRARNLRSPAAPSRASVRASTPCRT